MDIQKYIDIIKTSYSDYAGYMYQEITTLSWNNYFYWLIGISLFFFILEWWNPWRKYQSLLKKDFRLDVFYMFFNFFLFSLIGYHAISNVFTEAFNELLAQFGITNLVAVRINAWPVWLQLLTLFVVRDFLHWNIHRLLHRVPFLWEFHKVHHSAKEMNFATHLRFHPMETIVYRTLEYIPLGMIGFGIQEFFFVHIIALGIGHFNHSNIRIPLGPLKYLFNNPQMHTWHHAKHLPGKYKYGINYGLSLSIWDYLFKTAYIPYQGNTITLGYTGDEEMPDDFRKQTLYAITSFEQHKKQPAGHADAFDRKAPVYDRWFEKHKNLYQSELSAIQKAIPENQTGIEIGVGTGRFAEPLNIQYGIEPSENMAKFAEQRGITVYRAYAENIPLENATFDFALMVTTICFLSDIQKAFSEIYRILKPQGAIILGIIDKNSKLGKQYEKQKPENEFYKDAHFHSTQAITKYLKQTGFRDFSYWQTLTKPASHVVEQAVQSYGTGSFVVIKAIKKTSG